MKQKLKFKIIISILVILSIVLYSIFIEPNMLQITNYTLQNNDLKGLRIVLVSDIHIKQNQEKKLDKIVNLINKQNPDIVISLGDFFAGREPKETISVENFTEKFKNIKSKYGFYTVLGNRDWYFDEDKITESFTNNGIKVLSNSNIEVKANNKTIYIAGLEDLKIHNPNIKKTLKNTKHPVILLTHSPDIFPRVPEDVDLTLAGHLHGGQVRLPFWGAIYTVSKYGTKYSKGIIKENGKTMLVTGGIGLSMISARFNCAPEIVVIDFI